MSAAIAVFSVSAGNATDASLSPRDGEIAMFKVAMAGTPIRAPFMQSRQPARWGRRTLK